MVFFLLCRSAQGDDVNDNGTRSTALTEKNLVHAEGLHRPEAAVGLHRPEAALGTLPREKIMFFIYPYERNILET